MGHGKYFEQAKTRLRSPDFVEGTHSNELAALPAIRAAMELFRRVRAVRVCDDASDIALKMEIDACEAALGIEAAYADDPIIPADLMILRPAFYDPFVSRAFSDARMADARLLKVESDVETIADAPLWPDGEPEWTDRNPSTYAAEHWRKLKESLLSANQGWEVWIDWYDDRLGGRVADEDRDFAFATVPVTVWRQGAAAANAWIGERLAEIPTMDVSQSDPSA